MFKRWVGLGRIIGSLGAVAVCGAALVATTAGPAYAGCDDSPPLPDGVIRRVGGNFKGQGLECTLTPSVTVTQNRSAGQVAVYEVRFKNIEEDTRDIRIYNASAPDPTHYKTKILKGAKDLTDKIVAQYPDGKVFGGIASGAKTPTLTVRIKVRPAAPPGDVTYVHLLGQFTDNAVPATYDGVVAQVQTPA